ncbi:WD repeat-containing protein 47 [Perkinsus olseni]|uniref:WD repeat-containing protein 47 n=2 Tax=Perkinsus olseni TaxID=32597 RepID=A0A7J6KVC0_PEROL|nr:WD repeat-containing protein 47 [Perkinsus olseni]
MEGNRSRRPSVRTGSTLDGEASRSSPGGPIQEHIEVTQIWQYEDTQAIRCVSFSSCARYLGIGTNSRSLIVFDSAAIEDGETEELLRRDRYHAGSIYCMSWSPGSTLLVTGSNDQSVQVLSFDHSAELVSPREQKITPQAGTVRTVCAVTCSTFLSGSSNEQCVRMWDVENGKCKATLDGHRWRQAMAGNALSLSCGSQGDGGLVAVGSSGGSVSMWSLRSCSPVWKPAEDVHPHKDANSVSISSDAVYIGAGYEDGSVAIWDTRSTAQQPLVYRREAHGDSCRAVALLTDFGSQQPKIASVGFDHSLIVINGTNATDCTLHEHTDRAVGISWCGERRMLISSSADASARCFKLRC